MPFPLRFWLLKPQIARLPVILLDLINRPIDTAQTNFNAGQFKIWTNKMAAQVDFCLSRCSIVRTIGCVKTRTGVFNSDITYLLKTPTVERKAECLKLKGWIVRYHRSWFLLCEPHKLKKMPKDGYAPFRDIKNLRLSSARQPQNSSSGITVTKVFIIFDHLSLSHLNLSFDLVRWV